MCCFWDINESEYFTFMKSNLGVVAVDLCDSFNVSNPCAGFFGRLLPNDAVSKRVSKFSLLCLLQNYFFLHSNLLSIFFVVIYIFRSCVIFFCSINGNLRELDYGNCLWFDYSCW